MIGRARGLDLWLIDNEHYAYKKIIPDRDGLDVDIFHFEIQEKELASVELFSDYLAKTNKRVNSFGPNGVLVNFKEGLFIWSYEHNVLIPVEEAALK